MYITGVLVLAEVLFWIGVLLVGKEVAMKIKGYLSPKKWGKRVEKVEDVKGSNENDGDDEKK